jgi:hypothetical protein
MSITFISVDSIQNIRSIAGLSSEKPIQLTRQSLNLHEYKLSTTKVQSPYPARQGQTVKGDKYRSKI